MNGATPSQSTVASASLGLAVSTVLLWIGHEYAGIRPPPEVAGAFGVIVSTAIGYLFKGGMQDDVVEPTPSNAPEA